MNEQRDEETGVKFTILRERPTLFWASAAVFEKADDDGAVRWMKTAGKTYRRRAIAKQGPVGERAAKRIRRHVRTIYGSGPEAAQQREVAEAMLRRAWAAQDSKERRSSSRAMGLTRAQERKRERLALGGAR